VHPSYVQLLLFSRPLQIVLPRISWNFSALGLLLDLHGDLFVQSSTLWRPETGPMSSIGFMTKLVLVHCVNAAAFVIVVDILDVPCE
jgi:hypothetical protein